MTRGYTLLALGLVLLGGAAGRAAEIGTAQLPPESTPAAAPAQLPPAAGPATTAGASVVAPACGGACCAPPACGCAGRRHHSECWGRLCDWLTYCPPHVPCHCDCSSCGGGCRHCTPCCVPLYLYFLDRCSCTLGYRGLPPHPPLPPAAQDEGPGGLPSAPGTAGYGTSTTTGR